MMIRPATLVHTRVSVFLFGLCPDRTAATACLAVAGQKKSPEAAVPPTNALSPAYAGSEMVRDDLTARQAVAAVHSRQSRKSPARPSF